MDMQERMAGEICIHPLRSRQRKAAPNRISQNRVRGKKKSDIGLVNESNTENMKEGIINMMTDRIAGIFNLLENNKKNGQIK